MTHHHLDVLGSLAFTPVKSDMLGNIKVSDPDAAISPAVHWLIKASRKSVTAS